MVFACSLFRTAFAAFGEYSRLAAGARLRRSSMRFRRRELHNLLRFCGTELCVCGFSFDPYGCTSVTWNSKHLEVGGSRPAMAPVRLHRFWYLLASYFFTPTACSLQLLFSAVRARCFPLYWKRSAGIPGL